MTRHRGLQDSRPPENGGNDGMASEVLGGGVRITLTAVLILFSVLVSQSCSNGKGGGATDSVQDTTTGDGQADASVPPGDTWDWDPSSWQGHTPLDLAADASGIYLLSLATYDDVPEVETGCYLTRLPLDGSAATWSRRPDAVAVRFRHMALGPGGIYLAGKTDTRTNNGTVDEQISFQKRSPDSGDLLWESSANAATQSWWSCNPNCTQAAIFEETIRATAANEDGLYYVGNCCMYDHWIYGWVDGATGSVDNNLSLKPSGERCCVRAVAADAESVYYWGPPNLHKESSRYEASDWQVETPAYYDIVIGPSAVFLYADATLDARDPETGDLLWSVGDDQRTALAGDSTKLVGGPTGVYEIRVTLDETQSFVIGRDPASGDVVWEVSYDTGDGAFAPHALSERGEHLYVLGPIDTEETVSLEVRRLLKADGSADQGSQ
jgi:hypothetical protein